MPDDAVSNPLDSLQEALATGDMGQVRTALLALDQGQLAALTRRLGEEETQQLFRSVRNRRRGALRGRVIVIHGIMGGQLDSVKKSDADRVWLNYFRLFNGRISDFRLNDDGTPTDARFAIRVKGMFPEYLPLLNELAEQWDVLPFAFDWRLNIDDSARQLAKQVEDWGKGEPLHIVAHSMGGLVARRFIQLFPALWKSMQDSGNTGKGGRLVMLGTPNKGSHAIPLILSGAEGTVKKLEKLDIKHGMSELLDIINTFPGSYQMMPSPDVNADDDHQLLYDIRTWKGFPVVDQHLQTGRAFQQALTTVTDPDRLLYVAGYDQETPCRIKVGADGKFSYQTTMDGDGRVPHLFGLLEGVRTFYVREVHGDIPRNKMVLAAIHELLIDGITGALEVQLPATRSGKRGLSEWKRADQIEIPLSEEWSILAQPLRRGTTGSLQPSATPEEQEFIEASLASAYVGSPRGTARGSAKSKASGAGTSLGIALAAIEADKPVLQIRVVWGDVTKVAADVYVAGHYERVAPIGAELALDRIVSAIDPGNPADAHREPLLTALTRRGIMSGQLGHVQFFPWPDNSHRSVAIAGMGYPGSFGRTEMRILARSLTYAVGALPNAKSVSTVLIGSGAGSALDNTAAARGLILGMLDALASMPLKSHVRELNIVEHDYGKAVAILNNLQTLDELTGEEASKRPVLTRTHPELVYGEGGVFGTPDCMSLALQSVIEASRHGVSVRHQKALALLLDAIPEDGIKFRTLTVAQLREFSTRDAHDVIKNARSLNLRLGEGGTSFSKDPSTRISFVFDGQSVCAAAITDTSVVPERRLLFDVTLLDEAIERMTNPVITNLPDLSALLTRLVVPREFRELLAKDTPIVFEVDRGMARVHWEMLASDLNDGAEERPLGLRRPMSRQLRTRFSPTPTADFRAAGPLRALVVGDPGDPALNFGLPGAQDEAFAVTDLLQQKGVMVKLMVGAPSVPRTGRLKFVPPASRLDVLTELMRGGYDLLHYAGHGDFDPKRPDTAGWLFEGGLITSRELEQMDIAPRLVVANACLSALTSTEEGSVRGAEILPSLADEFFKRGVRDYVGTAWEVNDTGAVEFATAFYDKLIPDATTDDEGSTIGEALLFARNVLDQSRIKYDALWAAYQHYGDPLQRLVDTRGAGDDFVPVAVPATTDSKRDGAHNSAAKRGAAQKTSVKKAVRKTNARKKAARKKS